jgi:hypothetical protein
MSDDRTPTDPERESVLEWRHETDSSDGYTLRGAGGDCDLRLGGSLPRIPSNGGFSQQVNAVPDVVWLRSGGTGRVEPGGLQPLNSRAAPQPSSRMFPH